MFENLAEFHRTFGADYIADRMSRGWGEWRLEARDGVPEGLSLVHARLGIEFDVVGTIENMSDVLSVFGEFVAVPAVDWGYAMAAFSDIRWARYLCLGPWARTEGAA